MARVKTETKVLALRKEVLLLIIYSGSEATMEIIIRFVNFLNILRRQEMTTILKDWTALREGRSVNLLPGKTPVSSEDKQLRVTRKTDFNHRP